MPTTLYETDFAAWAIHSAALVREGRDMDGEQREEIAEELDALARQDRRERDSRTVTLIMHLLKIRYQPKKRSRSWDLTVALQRTEIQGLLKQSPSLNKCFDEALPEIYRDARRFAEIETGLKTFPEQNPFTLHQILNG